MTPLIPPLPPKFYPHKKILKQTFLSTEEWGRWWLCLPKLPANARHITCHLDDLPPCHVKSINGLDFYWDESQGAQRNCINVLVGDSYWQFIGPCD